MSTAAFPPDVRSALDGIAEQFYLPDERLVGITNQFLKDFNLGLGQSSQPVVMGPSFVSRVPDGTETGTFLTLDISWVSFRVSEIKLDGKKNFTERHKVFPLPSNIKTVEATEFFDLLANSVNTFLSENELEPKDKNKLQLGFTFPFPLQKTSLSQGTLLAWTKGFSIKNAVGQDVAKLLQNSFDRLGVPVQCTALINDTVATLLAKSYSSGGVLLAATFGIGTNCAYVEESAKVAKLKCTSVKGLGEKILVNTEWGAFDNKRTVLPNTSFDRKVDELSVYPGAQAFEKLVSWMYLGEITRNVLLSLVDQNTPILFNGTSTPELKTHHGFDTRRMTTIEEAKSLEEIKQVFVDFLGFDKAAISDQDAEIVRWVCKQVSIRSAKLAGSAIAAILIQRGHAHLGGGLIDKEKTLPIAANGELIWFYPNYETHLRDSLTAIVGKEAQEKVEVFTVHDGAAAGAALGAFEASAKKTSVVNE